jgi:hypothetical protein
MSRTGFAGYACGDGGAQAIAAATKRTAGRGFSLFLA